MIAPRSWLVLDGQSEQHQLEATFLLGMAPDVAAMLADWQQTNWFTVQGAALHFTGVRPGDPTADVMFAFAFAWFHRKLEMFVPCDLAPRRAVGRFRRCVWKIHIELPAYMDDFFLPVVSDTAADLLPRVALAREHGLQLNMASNKAEAVIDSRGKGRQQVLEDLALEFPVVDGQWTPTVKVAEGVSLRFVSTCRHLGTQDSHRARRGPELAARRSAARAAYQATRKKILSQRPLQEGWWRSPARLSAPVCSMELVLSIPSALLTSTTWRTRTLRPFGRLPMSDGGLDTFRRARKRCLVDWAFSISGRRSACRDCVWLQDI